MPEQISLQGHIKNFGRRLAGTGDVITPLTAFGSWLYRHTEYQDSDFGPELGADILKARIVLREAHIETPSHFPARYQRTMTGLVTQLFRTAYRLPHADRVDNFLQIMEQNGEVIAQWRSPSGSGPLIPLRPLLQYSASSFGELSTGRDLLINHLERSLLTGAVYLPGFTLNNSTGEKNGDQTRYYEVNPDV